MEPQSFRKPVLLYKYRRRLGKRIKEYGLYLCNCGKVFESTPNYVNIRGTMSCGCYQKLVTTTHGKSKHPLHKIWTGILQRIENPNSASYKYYGGRGLGICNEWRMFDNFYKDMAVGYAKGLTVDRIDNEKGYSPDNCRWATPLQQGRNKRNNIIIEYNGEELCLSEMAGKYNINIQTLYSRIFAHGWSVDLAISTPVDTARGIRVKNTDSMIYEYEGGSKHLKYWAKDYNIKTSTLYSRIKKGWSISRALTKKINHRELTIKAKSTNNE